MLLREIEEATITDPIEDEELVSMPSEEEVESESTFESLSGPDKDFFTLDYINQVLEYKDRHNVSFRTLKHRFQRVEHDVYLTRLRQYRPTCGTARERFDQVSTYT